MQKRKAGRHPVQQLTAQQVKRVTEPGRYFDGLGLYLHVSDTGAKSWIQRLMVQGKPREIGHGGYPLVSLAEARQIALDCKKSARTNGDPLTERRKNRGVPTFAAVTAAVLKLNRPSWRNEKHGKQWQSTLETYAFPRLGNRPVDTITTGDILAVLTPIWHEKPETAMRVRQRLKSVMEWSVAQGHRQDNPAGDAISKALLKRSTRVQHMRALPYGEVAAAIAKVRASDATTIAKLAFEFLVLTAARSGEVRGATLDEIDLENRTWTIPADRMKAGVEHRVPLSDRSVTILLEAAKVRTNSRLVFPSVTDRQLSDNALSKLLRKNGILSTVHGFRSSFRDWAGERTGTSHEVMEQALAHTIPNHVERAYARSDLFEKRRSLMDSWAAFLEAKKGNVIRIA